MAGTAPSDRSDPPIPHSTCANSIHDSLYHPPFRSCGHSYPAFARAESKKLTRKQPKLVIGNHNQSVKPTRNSSAFHHWARLHIIHACARAAPSARHHAFKTPPTVLPRLRILVHTSTVVCLGRKSLYSQQKMIHPCTDGSLVYMAYMQAWASLLRTYMLNYLWADGRRRA